MLGLLRRRPKSEQRETRSLTTDWLSEIFGVVPTISGPCVTATTAMRCAAVRCAVQVIAEAIGQLPVHAYRRGGDGSKERAPELPVQTLLHDAANDFTPASEFREQLTRDALLHDTGGLAFVNRVRGRPVELLRFEPGAISVEYDPADGAPIYRRNGVGNGTIIPRQNIFHIRAPGGRSPVSDAREAIALAMVLEQHAARLFGRGGRPSGVLAFPHKLGSEVAIRIRESWQAAHAGENSGRTAVLEEGGSFVPLSLTSVDSQFLELRQFAIAEISRAFRVPPILLMDYGRATWGNSEEMGRQFLTYTLMPWLKRWEGEIRLKLFGPEERDEFFAEFLVDDLLRADIGKRADAYSKLIAARVLNPNEARAMENRPPYDGGDKFENPNTSTAAKPSAADAQ